MSTIFRDLLLFSLFDCVWSTPAVIDRFQPRGALLAPLTWHSRLKDQSGAWRNGTSFGLNDLDEFINVACEVKEWMAAHALKR